MSIFLVDVETTGVGQADKVCEVAYLEIDGNFEILSQDVSLINPGIPIDPAASAVNGITDSMVAGAPTLEEYMEAAGNPLMRASVVVAHNLSFDYRFLKAHINPEAEHLCTLKCARVLYPGASSHKQAALAYMLGLHIDRAKAHSADGDLMVLHQLLERMCRDAECGIADLIEIQAQAVQFEKIWFGVHRGKYLKDIPADYVQWLLTKANIKDDLRKSLEALHP